MIPFIIWSIVAVVFIIIGVSAWNSKEEAGFFSNSKPPKMKDVKKYNHAVAKIWFTFATILEVLGIPLLFAEQNSPVFIVTILGVFASLIGIIIIYLRVEKKYTK